MASDLWRQFLVTVSYRACVRGLRYSALEGLYKFRLSLPYLFLSTVYLSPVQASVHELCKLGLRWSHNQK